jgi:hypothetical protein
LPISFSKAKLDETSFWLAQFREDWRLETPIRIHGFGVDDGHGLGGPPFHPEFEHYLGPICFCGRKAQCAPGCRVSVGGRHLTTCDPGCPTERVPKRSRNTDSRLRTTRAFRKLRRVAPREFDVLYLMCALDSSFEATQDALNQRALRLGKPERYGIAETLLLVVSGVDKVRHYW